MYFHSAIGKSSGILSESHRRTWLFTVSSVDYWCVVCFYQEERINRKTILKTWNIVNFLYFDFQQPICLKTANFRICGLSLKGSTRLCTGVPFTSTNMALSGASSKCEAGHLFFAPIFWKLRKIFRFYPHQVRQENKTGAKTPWTFNWLTALPAGVRYHRKQQRVPTADTPSARYCVIKTKQICLSQRISS